jgi:glycosyltransferase involved in cell wall biosynthesis
MSTELLYKTIYNPTKEIIYSVITPVYNQENIIVENLQSIINNTNDNFEIILILDFCFDNTEQNIMNFLGNYENKVDNFIQITIFKNQDKPLFETKCDNIGFKNSSGKYCLEIQADMKMVENGYNLHLTKPFNVCNNVIAVSGRCAHNLFNHQKGIGKLGCDIETPINNLNVCKNKFYVYETCNRGPLLIDKKKLEELNFLNEEEYFLDDSDHDLMARAYIEKRYICGYVAIDFDAPLCLGSTRNHNNYNNCKEYIINNCEKEAMYNKCAGKSGLNKFRDIWPNTEHIIYDI